MISQVKNDEDQEQIFQNKRENKKYLPRIERYEKMIELSNVEGENSQKNDDKSPQSRGKISPQRQLKYQYKQYKKNQYSTTFVKSQQTNFETQIENQLLKKRKLLLKQLQNVEIQLNSVKINKKNSNQNRLRIRTSLSTQKQQQYYKKADNLIRNLKQQRQQRVFNRKITLENKDIKRNLSQIENYNVKYSYQQDEQLMKQQRRKCILQKIQQRKQYAQMRKQANKRSNSLIKQLIQIKNKYYQNHTVSDKCLLEKQIHKNYSHRFNSQNNYTSNTDEITFPTKEKEISIKKKIYKPGHFLIQLLQQDERKKSQQKLKILQRRRVILKHKQYSQKIKSQTRAISTYLTQIN